MTTDESTPSRVTGRSDPDSISVELSKRRTGMSFHRTRMSADRTLMSVMRTSLSLISFGFTIFQIFQKLHEVGIVETAGSARAFGESLVFLGIGMLIVGIGYHVAFMIGLRKERDAMRADGLVHAESAYPASMSLIVAIMLLLIGCLAIYSMLTGAWSLG